MLLTILSTLLLVIGLCVDTFVTSFSYGVNKIKIPFISAIVINLVSTTFLAISLYFGKLVSSFLSPSFTTFLGFIILFILGFLHLGESLLKVYWKRRNTSATAFDFKLFDMKFTVNMEIAEEDLYNPKTRLLKSSEAASIAIAISIDELAIGFGLGLVAVSPLFLIGLFALCAMISVFLGSFLGRTLAVNTDLNLSWITGATLLLIAFSKFF